MTVKIAGRNGQVFVDVHGQRLEPISPEEAKKYAAELAEAAEAAREKRITITVEMDRRQAEALYELCQHISGSPAGLRGVFSDGLGSIASQLYNKEISHNYQGKIQADPRNEQFGVHLEGRL